MRYFKAVVALLTALVSATAVHAKIVEETLDLPVQVSDARGAAVRQPIKVVVFRDDARARSPFLILNHGRSSDPAKRQAVKAAQFAANARYFVSRGFAVFFPVRIGYGLTGGPNIENSGPCEAKNYRHTFEVGAQQSIAVIEHAKTLPYVDPQRGIVLGQSFGGTNAITLAAKNIPGVLAAVNFGGGGGGRPDTNPGQPCGIDRMTDLFASYGATARIPTLWFYSENDQYWGPSIPRAWHKAFIDAGGRGEFVQLPSYKADGHSIFTGRPDTWQPAFEAFAEGCCPADKSTVISTAAAERNRLFTRLLASWASKHKIGRAVIVVRRGGRVLHQAGIGGADPAEPVLLASLSKAITGACVGMLVRDGKLGFDWPLSKALAKYFKAHGLPADSRIPRITIAQLLTHRAGFSSAADGEDPATRSVLTAYLGDHSTREAPAPDFVSMVLAAGLLREPGATFAYSNAGYFTLGAVIEEATGQSYESYCRDAVLKPVGVSAALDPRWGVLWSAGGWRMAGDDYLKFYEMFNLRSSPIGKRAIGWMLDRTGKNYGKTRYPVWYGLGVRLRDRGQGLEVWHTGSFARSLPPDPVGPRTVNTSTLAFRAADGTSWFVHSTPLVLGAARNELIDDLLSASRTVPGRN